MSLASPQVQGLEPVRWGVIGASHFAVSASLPAMQQAPLCHLMAIASRSSAKAKQAAARCGIPRGYARYEAVLEHPEIEAIYIPLPNHMHAEWALRAIRAGKHVLCEKPITLNTSEAQRLLTAQRETKVHVAEAFMVRHHPQWQRVVELVHGGRIGQVRVVNTIFSYKNDDPANIRNQRAAGGGALYDIGCYAINTARLIFAAEPRRVAATCEMDPKTGCDCLTSAMMEFDKGLATFSVGTQQVPYQRVHIFGTEGHIEVEIPFNAPHDRPCRVFVDGGLLDAPDFTVAEDSSSRAEVINLPEANHYTLQAETFSRSIRTGARPDNDIAEAIANMRVIDAAFRASDSGRWELV